MKSPSDLKILSTIYDTYYKQFETFTLGAENGRASKPYLPIDCKLIAQKLKVDGDIIFGRLYYHLQEKYGYTREDKTKVAFFTLMAGGDRHCINFPLMASVLAGLQEENSKTQRATLISTLAIVISITVPIVSWLAKAS
ncbi:MAG: hypothetical protein KJ643_15245 [Gammaproteobacteria bacterium]|uniref:hypothetical protein n=1 Tax=Pseudomonas mandelii TaxID=75612 RepID=UPI0012B21041|nr:hypothetical protein [Pseudomonas mandelii]MBU0523588.1 hypothetical protein [Gammaproteobacteria bacterium]MBU0844624.1 hypothetical protein [Gammaproteobacteria bacterium]MBU1843677.1 hypothetical protein [Gammaproteobacteria bacterium]